MNLRNFLKRIVLPGIGLLCYPLWAQVASSEQFLEAPGPTGALKGTLIAPAVKSAPMALIIPGSGATDRDGNNPFGVKAATYRLLAEGLAARGVATLRIDKRGMFASAAATPDANAVTIADYVSDVRSWVSLLRKHTGASCVWLLGHSEGALVAMASATEQADVCGLVLVAAAGRPLGEVMRAQLKANPANAPLLDQALPAIDALEQGRRVDTTSMHPALQGLFNPAVQGFLISAFSYDPQRLLAPYSRPVLVLQGQRDIQVQAADARLLKEANPKASLVLLPTANHVLKTVTSVDRRANVATYADPSLPLAPGVVDAIAEFLVGKTESVK
jgi:pimeloyl-ACP methyl ester carboxylesterase